MTERDRFQCPAELLDIVILPLTELTAISPVDGRYAEKTAILRNDFSEYALMRGRILVEVRYLFALSDIDIVRRLTYQEKEMLERIWKEFSEEDAKRIKQIEATTRHDAKAVEYFFKEELQGTSLVDIAEMVHIGLTSEDPTNIAQSLHIATTKDKLLVPSGWGLTQEMLSRPQDWTTAMLGRTHGKDAVPTTVAKEVSLFGERLSQDLEKLQKIKLTGKLNGAVGNYNALRFAYPDVDWIKFSESFIRSFDLEPNLFTTQVEPHDRWAEVFQILTRMNTKVRSFSRNMRGYVEHKYFDLLPKEGQIGSSTMPHKGRNPTLYENAAGMAIVANALLNMFIEELPDRRFQRDLEDSAISRFIGVALGATYISWQNAFADLTDTVLRRQTVENDLKDNWQVVTEGIQTRLRAIGMEKPYEKMAELAAKGEITRERLEGFINALSVSDEEKTYLLSVTPQNYIGLARELTNLMRDAIQARHL